MVLSEMTSSAQKQNAIIKVIHKHEPTIPAHHPKSPRPNGSKSLLIEIVNPTAVVKIDNTNNKIIIPTPF